MSALHKVSHDRDCVSRLGGECTCGLTDARMQFDEMAATVEGLHLLVAELRRDSDSYERRWREAGRRATVNAERAEKAEAALAEARAPTKPAAETWDTFEFNTKDEGERVYLMQFETEGLTRGIRNSMWVPWEIAEPMGQWMVDRARQKREAT